jgi:xylulose-5-phosphate/fructose-6-phosphate phosphoketolase
VGQIYLLDNPLLRERCSRNTSSRAARSLGHDPGLNFVHAHLNRAIRSATST